MTACSQTSSFLAVEAVLATARVHVSLGSRRVPGFRLSRAHSVDAQYDLCKNKRNIDKCVEFEMPKVKVPIVFFGTVVFSPLRDRRYCHEESIVAALRPLIFKHSVLTIVHNSPQLEHDFN